MLALTLHHSNSKGNLTVPRLSLASQLAPQELDPRCLDHGPRTIASMLNLLTLAISIDLVVRQTCNVAPVPVQLCEFAARIVLRRALLWSGDHDLIWVTGYQ